MTRPPAASRPHPAELAHAPTSALEVDGLRCTRAGRRVFDGLEFALGAGEALLLRGANGSGKSSLLRQLCGLLPIEHGLLRWRAQVIDANDASYRAELAYLGHGNALSAELTALENLRAALALAGVRIDEAACRRELEVLGLARHADREARRLSMGQRRRVALARVLLSQRRLWLLDEPDAGLDAAGLALLDQRLAAHRASGGLAIVATHREPRAGERVLSLSAEGTHALHA